MRSFLTHSLLFVFLSFSMMLHGQGLAYYSFSSAVDSTQWVILADSNSIIPAGSGDNGVSAICPIGFRFPFGEESYAQFSVNTDGNFRLGPTATTNLAYNNPFSSFNSATNTPKINLLGCDGYMADNGYVRYQSFAGIDGDSLLVVEFATSTFSSSSRASLLKWQIHLHKSGDIVMIAGPETPSVMPAVSRQPGLCVNSSDGWVITSDTTAVAFTSGSSLSVPSRHWYDAYRCFTFARPRLACPRIQSLSYADVTSHSARVSFVPADTSINDWILTYDTLVVPLTTTEVVLDGLRPHTDYSVSVKTNCGTETSIETYTSFTTLYGLPPISQIQVDSIRPCAARISWNYIASQAEYQPTAYRLTLNSIDTTMSFLVGGRDTIIGGLTPQTNYQVVLASCADSLIGESRTTLFRTSDSACSRPLLTATASRANAVEIHWVWGGLDSIGIVEYRSNDDSLWIFLDTVASPSATLDGLLGGKAYAIRIGSVCTDTTLYAYSTAFVPSCSPVAYLRGTADTASIKLYWQSESASFKVEYGLQGFESGQGSVLMTQADSCILTGLTPDTRYDVKVYAVCVPGDTTAAAEISISTACLCPEVSSLHANVLSASSAVLDWNAGGADSLWQIEYGMKGFSHGLGTTILTYAHPDTLIGLAAGSRYDAYVRPLCGTSDTGRWMKTQFVTNPCINPIGIGVNDTDAVSSNSPLAAVNNNRNYSLTEIILDRAILNGANEFVALDLFYTGQVPMIAKNDVDIYLMSINIDTFASANDFIPLQPWAKKVYSGPLNCTYGWNTFVFDSVYVYGGWDNLMAVIDDNSGASDGPSCTFRTLSASSGKMLSISDDILNPDLDSLDSLSYSRVLVSGRPEMQLVTCGAVCGTPFLTTTTSITCQSATIHWIGTAPEYEFSYRASSDSRWTETQSVGNDSVNLSDLLANTRYSYRVRQVCDSNLYSEWVSGTFVTDTLPCLVPTDLHSSSVVVGGVVLEWDDGGVSQPQTWIINLFSDEENRMDTIHSTFYSAMDLTDGVVYHAAVRKICHSGYVTDWSDTIDFTTLLCRPVADIKVRHVTHTSAELSWTPGGNSNEWMIQYGDLSLDEDSVIVILGQSSYSLTLTPYHRYHAKVRSICDDRAFSEWSEDIEFNATSVGVDEVSASQVRIYPNPTSSTANIEWNGLSGVVNVYIYDMNGRLLFHDKTAADVLKTPALPQGAYLVKVIGEDALSVHRLIVQ